MTKKKKHSPVMSELLRRRLVVLDGKIDRESIERVCGNMLELQLRSSEEIFLILRSGGGSIHAALELCDLMSHFIVAPITGIAIGNCSSAATYIMLHCDKRLSTPHVNFVIHSGTMSGFSIQMKDGVTEKDFKRLLEESKKISERTIKLYVDKLTLNDSSGKPLSGKKRH